MAAIQDGKPWTTGVDSNSTALGAANDAEEAAAEGGGGGGDLSTVLLKAQNLADLANAGTARTNLALGDAATKATGTAAGTVAAGDDARIVGAAQTSANLSDLGSASTSRSNLGLGTAAVGNISATTPGRPRFGGLVGSSANAARADHRHPSGDSNSYARIMIESGLYSGAGTQSTSGLLPLTQNNARISPFSIRNAITLDRLGIEVTTAGSGTSFVRMALYTDDGTGNRPANLIVDTGQIASDTTGWKEATISLAVDSEIIWMALVGQGSSSVATVRAWAGAAVHAPLASPTGNIANSTVGYSDTISGAFPSTWTSFTTVGGTNQITKMLVRGA